MHELQKETQVARVLVVGELHNGLRLLTTLLAEEGHRVVHTTNGAEALKLAVSTCADLVVVDVDESSDGYAVCERLGGCEAMAGVSVLLVGVGHEASERARAFQVGAADYLTKPLQREEALARIRTQLRVRELAKREAWARETHLRFVESLDNARKETEAALSESEAALSESEAALSESEAEMRSLLSAMTDIVLVGDAEGRYLKIADTSPELLYQPAKDVLGKTVHEVFPKDQADFFLDTIHRALDSGIAQRTEYSLGIGEKKVWFDATISPMSEDKYVLVARNISDRKKSEEALKHAAKVLKQAQHLANLGNWELDLTNHRLTWSGEVFRIFEIETDDFGSSYEDFLRAVHPDDRAMVDRAYLLSLATRIPYSVDHRLLMADGRVKYVHEHCETYFDGDRPVRSIGTVQDITERKQAERELRKSESFLNNVVEHIPNILFVKDARTLAFVRFNEAGERLMGFSRSDLLGKTDYDLFAPEEAESVQRLDRRALAGKEVVDVVEMLRDGRGRMRCVQTKRIPILDEEGVPRYLLGISEDITDRRQAEEAIRKLSQAIEQSPVAIMITDIAGNIEFVNTRFSEVSGYSREEVLGQNPRLLQSGDTPRQEFRRLWETITKGKTWRGLLHNRKKTGEIFLEQSTIAPVRDAEGVITHFVAVKEDVTAYRKLEEQVRQTQRMEAIGQLAGGVAHDFNNMLSVIMGRAELALRKASPSDAVFNDLQEIRHAAQRSGELTRQLLTFARKQDVTPMLLDLNETIGGILKFLSRLIGEDIDLVWRPGPAVWPVKVDPSQVDQILANLCVNARDAIGGVGKVTIRTHNSTFTADDCGEHGVGEPGDYVVVAVGDDGCGMSAETVARVFEPFFTTKSAAEGTGLGLSTVYGIVRQNQGFVSVDSELGKGTTFKLYLPRCIDEAGRDASVGSVSPVKRGDEGILLVEDELSLLELTKLMLESCGYQVFSASRPREALRMVEAHAEAIQLVVTDVIMPEMSGRGLERELLVRYPKLVFLFMSGYAGSVIEPHGVMQEGVHFIEKPFSVQALAGKVREVLDGGRPLLPPADGQARPSAARGTFGPKA